LDRPAFKGYLSTFEGYLVTFISIRFTPYCCHARVTPQAQNGEVKHYRDGAKLDRHAFKSHSSTFEGNLVTFISIKFSPYCCYARVTPQAQNEEDKHYGDSAKLDRHAFKGY
jgi:hypothetical protein